MIDNTQDIIDSRDVIDRIEELKKLRYDVAADMGVDKWVEDYPEEVEELRILEALEEEASGSLDWEYGEALIRDSYFEEYAQELAEDTGAIDRNAIWPLCFIDWEEAARALQIDYFAVDFDGVTYWIRA